MIIKCETYIMKEGDKIYIAINNNNKYTELLWQKKKL
jgi:hypothetical protein